MLKKINNKNNKNNIKKKKIKKAGVMGLLLENKLCLVTGGSRALGKAISIVLAREGADVALTYRKNEEEAKEVKREIEALGRKGYIYQLDVRQVAKSKELANKMAEQGLVPDVLINNAGVSQVVHLSMMDEEDYELVMGTNVKGTFFVTKAFLRGMIRKRKGKIINVSSLAGVHLIKAPVHYSASKAAIVGFTMALSKEIANYNITVNGIAPGLLDEGVGINVPETNLEDYLKHNSLGRLGKCEEVAELIAFMASDRNSYMNGETILLDGGV
ncbi:MAG: SDR family oxidoreductase [Oligoflexia bacterium]|nr:SDR family oxidoreductase [Oligoflexia bacterium]